MMRNTNLIRRMAPFALQVDLSPHQRREDSLIAWRSEARTKEVTELYYLHYAGLSWTLLRPRTKPFTVDLRHQ